MSRWHIYLVRCRDGALYTGIATDVARRFEEHRNGNGKGAKYLRGRGPLRLVLEQSVGDRGVAQSVESRIKRLPKARKERLVQDADAIERMVAQARDRTNPPEA